MILIVCVIGYGIIIKNKCMRIQNLILFYGQQFDFQFLYKIYVLNYHYFYTDISIFLNKNV